MELQQILAGRRAVDAYRQAHAEGLGDVEALLKELQRLGFKDIEDFFRQNEEFVLQDALASIILIGGCDKCAGRVHGCGDLCYQDRLAGKEPESLAERYKLGLQDKEGIRLRPYLRQSFTFEDLKEGFENPLYPNCSVKIKCVKTPSLGWFWR